MGQIASSFSGEYRFPVYRPLDVGRNEIRLLTARSPSIGKDVVEYNLDYVSLDDYTPAYAKFLSQGGRELPTSFRFMVWENFTIRHEYPEMADEMWEGMPPSIRNESLRQACSGEEFSGANRWMWGDFAALSYEWGNPKSLSKIVVDDIGVSVTRNLADALKHIQRVCRSRSENFRGSDGQRIWVDALCINQLDIAERNLQVKRMNQIYSDAGRVFIWTGLAWKTAKEFSDIMSYLATSSLEIDLDVEIEQPREAKTVTKWRQLTLESAIWRDGMRNLMARTYFSRLWIIQEIVLANSTAEVFFGDFSCTLTTVLTGYDLIKLSFSLFAKNLSPAEVASMLADYSNISSLMGLVRVRYERFDSQRLPPLATLMAAGRLAKQLDPRDKIYALVGLMEPGLQDHVHPDYDPSATLEQVYHQFIVSVFQYTKRLDLIYQGAANPIRNQSLPTWVPDWSIPLRYTDDPGDCCFYANSRASGDTVHDFIQAEEPTHLICKAFKFDELYSLACSSSPWADHDEHDYHPCTVKPPTPQTTNGKDLALDSTLTLGSSGHTTVYGEDVNDMLSEFWSTISMGYMPRSENEVSAFFQSVPWFNRSEDAQKVDFFSVMDRFQQCNKEIFIAGNRNMASLFPPLSLPLPHLEVDSAAHFVACLDMTLLRNRKFVTTKKGYFGMAPLMAEPTDEIFVVAGCTVPLLLRPVGNERYHLVGECYVQGIMEGEAVKDDSEWDRITLV